MNAKVKFSNFALDIVLKMISQALLEGVNDNRISISVILDYEVEQFEEYEEVLNFLKKQKIIKDFRSSGKTGNIQDEEGIDHQMYFYTPSFTVDHKKMNEFLIETSRIPKYSLRMDEKRRLILNDKYLLVTPNFNSSNWYFVDYCLKHSGEVITKQAIEKETKMIMLRFHSILDNLGIAPNLTEIFFPNVSGVALHFRNNVTKKELNSDINEDRINKYIGKLKKIK